ncbi:hypothetical protein BKA57DRAFT_519533 [Linnemannia elongata]|nr:hypothetical protein BKA57DRAFT_519533 [Linnemannia elongata]
MTLAAAYKTPFTFLISHHLVEYVLLLLSEVAALKVPEWILGDKSGWGNIPLNGKRIEILIAAVRFSTTDFEELEGWGLLPRQLLMKLVLISSSTRNPFKDVHRFAEEILTSLSTPLPAHPPTVAPGQVVTQGSHRDDSLCYNDSKLATVMFVRHLARLLAHTHPSTTVNCLHSGSCNTNLFKNSLLLSVLTTIGLYKPEELIRCGNKAVGITELGSSNL